MGVGLRGGERKKDREGSGWGVRTSKRERERGQEGVQITLCSSVVAKKITRSSRARHGTHEEHHQALLGPAPHHFEMQRGEFCHYGRAGWSGVYSLRDNPLFRLVLSLELSPESRASYPATRTPAPWDTTELN